MPAFDLARFAKLAASGLNGVQIAREMGTSPQYVCKLAKRHGITIVGRRKPKIDFDRLRELLGAGHTTAEIAEAFDVDDKAVIPACRRFGLPLPRTAPPPDKMPASPPAPLDPRTAALVETGGRHAPLAEWALRWGLSQAQARIEWSRLRLPLVPDKPASAKLLASRGRVTK